MSSTLEEKLLVSRDRLQLLMDCAPVLLAYVDHQERYILCNSEHENWFDISVKKITGTKISDLLDEQTYETIKPCSKKALRGEECSMEVQLNHRSKGPRICKLTFTPRLADEETVEGYCFLAMDINDTKRAEAEEERKKNELIKLYRQVQLKNRELEEFAAVCSHDLQEPLRTIQAYINLLKKRYTEVFDDKADSYFYHLGQSAQRMQAMIDSLLDYARLDLSKQEKTPVDMNSVLRQACKNLDSLIAKNGAVITSGSLPVIDGYPSHLLRLTQNLLSNSIKYRGKAAPAIHISSQANEEGYLFSFCDNGIGIEPQHGDIIFSLFRRLHTSEHSEGRGIGLSVCKKIVENHDGRLWYTSEKGQGTTFFFTLPDEQTAR